jgi:hypothetical protein
MKIAYLVCAHRNPRLVKRTVDFLSRDDASFFVHIDAKSDIRLFESIRGENVIFTETRIPVYWAEFSIMDAVLLLIRQALASPQSYDYFVLLGGSEFPLRSSQYIHDFLERNRGSEFITLMKMPPTGIARLNTLRFPVRRPVLRFIFRSLAKFGMAQRDYRKRLGGLVPYSGTMWWTLSREACQHVIEFTQSDRKLAAFMQNAQHASDECFIHTILGNSPFKARVRRNLVYEDWPANGPRHSPGLLSVRNLEYFESQDEVSAKDLHDGPGEMLFARKFSDDNLHLVERIAVMIGRKERCQDHASVESVR